jgi:hypothetical protein
VLKRFASKGVLFAPVLKLRQSLPATQQLARCACNFIASSRDFRN